MLGFREKIKFFISPNSSDRLCSPPSLLLNGHRKSFTRVKRPKHELDNSLASTSVLGKSAAILLLSHIPSWRREGSINSAFFTFILGKTKILISIFYRRGALLSCRKLQSQLCVNGSSYRAVNHVRLSYIISSVHIPSFFEDPCKTNKTMLGQSAWCFLHLPLDFKSLMFRIPAHL